MIQDFLNLKQETKCIKYHKFHLHFIRKKNCKMFSNVILFETQQEI